MNKNMWIILGCIGVLLAHTVEADECLELLPPEPAISDDEILGDEPVGLLAEVLGTTVCTNETEATEEIKALARTLKNDPVKIYSFVRNQIDYRPGRGVHVGAAGCLQAGYGNAWDQSALLSSLLRTAGYPTRFVYGLAFYYREDVEPWIGAATNRLPDILMTSGLRSGGVRSGGVPQLHKMYIFRFWVEARVDGSWYTLDPAFKEYERFNSTNLVTEMGYSQTNFLAAVTDGATVTSDYAQYLNSSNLNQKLTTYTTNLLAHIRAQSPNASVEEVLGGQRLVADVITNLPTALPSAYYVRESSLIKWDHVLDADHLTFRIQHKGIDVTLKGYEVAGKPISIYYASGSSHRSKLAVDGERIATGDSTTDGNTYTVIVETEHPYYVSGHADRTNELSVVSGGRYVIVRGIGDVSEKQIKSRSKVLGEYLSDGLGMDDKRVWGETLHLAASSYLQQRRLSSLWLSRQSEVSNHQHHWIGLAGQKEGFYIDLPWELTARHSLISTNREPMEVCRRASAFVGSALEHGVFEQRQGIECVSTVKLLHLANQNDDRVYLATDSNWNSVRSALQNYSSSEKSNFDDDINDGYMLVLPRNADITLEDWTGQAYFKYGESLRLEYVIQGDYHGGYASAEGEVDPEKEDQSPWYERWFGIGRTASVEPVDLFTGAYLSDHTDLIIGQQPEPLGLSFSRSYNSQSVGTPASIGEGWGHNCSIRATSASKPAFGLGERSSYDAVAFAVQSLVLTDLMSGDPDVLDWVACSLTAQWGMNRLTTNVVDVKIGDGGAVFCRQPDGSFSTPPNVTWELSESNGSFLMKTREGKEYRFRSDGWIDEIVDADSNTLSFAYNAQTNLQTVTDAFGRTLTLGYASNRISTVSDSTGRQTSYGYDANGNLTTYTDPEDNAWTYQYDANHQITAIIDPENITTIQNHYDPIGCVTQQISATSNVWNFYTGGGFGVEEDPFGGQTIHRFDSEGRNLGTENALGHQTYNMYDGQGHLVSQIDLRGSTNLYVYDADHNLLFQTEAVGTPEERTATYGYDNQHRLTAITNALGDVTRYQYDAEHHVIGVTNAMGDSVVVEYWPNGLPKKKTEDGGRITEYTYDSYGSIDAIISTDAGTVDLSYNVRGELVQRTDGRGQTTDFTFDANRNPLVILHADGSSVSNSYWDNGLLKETTDGKGETVSKVWNNAYKLQTVTFPDGGVVSNTYDAADRLIATKNTKVNITSNTLDAVGRVINRQSEIINRQFFYDPSGNITNSSVDPSGLNLWTRSEYDSLNRPVSVSSVNSVVENSYDLLGRVTNRIDAASKHWKTEYDALGRPVKTTRPTGAEERTGYNVLSYRTSFTNAEGKVISFGLDAQGRVTSITNAIGKVTRYQFDANGNMTNRTDAMNRSTVYSFDGLNRINRIQYPDNSTASFDYDLNSNMTEASNQTSEVSFDYDSMNRLFSSLISVHSRLFAVTNSYDLNGNRTNIAYPDGLMVSYAYDAENRLESVTTKYTNDTKTTSFAYDGASRLSSMSYPNGVTSTFDYDAESRITNYTHGTFLHHVIERDPRGFKMLEDIYEGLVPAFTSEVHQSRTHNAADQLIAAGDLTYSYNANGCLTSSVSSAQSADYFYDYDNRLINADGIEYLYDASGVRVARIAGVSPAVTNYFVVDYVDSLKRPLAETDSSGTITRYYVWAGSRLLAHIEADGTTRYYHSDELGSTLVLTDESGTPTDQFAYSPYGQGIGRTGTTDTPYQWLGGYGVYYDSATDLHLTLYRAYSAQQKRFISSDPKGIDGGANLYAYGNLNPLAFVDPLGLVAIQIGLTESAGAITGENISHGWAASLSWQHGFQLAKYTSMGGGSHMGMSGGGGFEFNISRNQSVDNLSGETIEFGAGGGLLGNFGAQINLPVDGSGAASASGFTAMLGGGGEAHVYGNKTWIGEKVVNVTPWSMGSYIVKKVTERLK